MRLVAATVTRLLRGRAVVAQAVRLDDQAALGPEEIHAEAVHERARLRQAQSGAARKGQEAAFELGVGEDEGVPVEELAQGCDPGPAGYVIKSIAKYVGLDQVALVRLVDSAFESRPRQNSGQIDEDVHSIDNRKPVNLGRVPLEFGSPANPKATSRFTKGHRWGRRS